MYIKIFTVIVLCFFLACCSSPDQENNGNDEPQVSTSKVLIFDNFDSDYKNPPFNDKLTIMNSEGQVLKTISEFNICQTIGGCRKLCVSDDGQNFVVCENVSGKNPKLYKYDISGDLIFSIDGFYNSICIHNNFIYACISTGLISGLKKMHKINASGHIVAQKTIALFDVVIDPINEVLWTVGNRILKADLNLNQILSIDPITWSAVSVDVNPDGSVWVAERKHPQVTGSKDRLLKVSPSGTIQKIINFPLSTNHESAIFCVRVNKNNGNLWAVGYFGIKKYDQSGNEVLSIEDLRAWAIDIDPFDNSVWVGGWDDIRHYSREGLELGIYTSGFSVNDQTWVAIAVAN